MEKTLNAPTNTFSCMMCLNS